MVLPEDLVAEIARILVENLWNHPEDERGRKLREKYASLEDAVKGVTEEAIRAFSE